MSLTSIEQFINTQMLTQNCLMVSVSTDTRTIKKGDLFVALNGPNFDANDFVEKAYQLGAAGAIVTRMNSAIPIPQLVVDDTLVALGELAQLKRSRTTAKVVAITGSSGKTSVKGMVQAMAQCEAGKDDHSAVVATKGNLNNHIGVPLTLLNISNTTKFLIVEAGTSNPGEISHLTHLIDPHVSVVTNVGNAHIEFFGSEQSIAQEKSCIYSDSSSDTTCIINMQDDFVNVFERSCASRPTLRFFSSQEQREVVAEDAVNQSIDTISAVNIHNNTKGFPCFDLISKQQVYPVSLSVLGRHSIDNALAAAACAVALGLSMASIVDGLNQYHGVNGRMQIKRGSDYIVIDDSYNANKESMLAAIDYLSRQKNTVLILGDMGELGAYSDQYHNDVGRYAKKNGINELHCTGKYATAYANGFGVNSRVYSNQADLITYLKSNVLSGCTILIKGSRSAGMEKIVASLTCFEEVS